MKGVAIQQLRKRYPAYGVSARKGPLADAIPEAPMTDDLQIATAFYEELTDAGRKRVEDAIDARIAVLKAQRLAECAAAFDPRDDE